MIRARAAAFFDDDDDDDGAPAPTWIMGVPYSELREEERRLDVFSTMWITYRSGFPRMEPYGYTDDSGWGCMLRSAQMLMVQALQRHMLGRSWRVPRTLEERLRIPEYRTLVRLFADHPGEESLFSIHNMCQVGIRYDKLPGEWYGPSTAACVLRDIAELYAARSLRPAAPKRTRPESDPGGGSGGAPPRPQSSAAAADGLTPANTPAPVDSVVSDEPPEAGDGRVEKGVGGRDPERPAGAPPAEENGGACCRDGSGDRGGDSEVGGGGAANGEGGGAGFAEQSLPSRPLRVFVSQGDVVYIDEVEAVAVRGGDGDSAAAGVAAAAAAAAENGNTCGAKGGEASGASTKKLSEPAATNPLEDKEGGSPAFFDPLLNPGSGGGQESQQKAWSSAVVLLVPLRLGLDELSEGYIPSLLQTLRVPQSLGFLGGRPNHAIFFIGAQGETLTGLDPHTTQAAPDMGGGFPSERYVHSLHCQSAVSMDVHRIDPSLALAFYLPDRPAFDELIEKTRETSPPPFSVEQTRPDYEGEMGLAFMINERDDDGTTDDDDDEYVFVKGPER
ncbi:unnamed protein product [Scytosiphon promiscuus]